MLRASGNAFSYLHHSNDGNHLPGMCDINQSDFTVKFSRLNFEAHVETVNYLCYKIIFISKTDGKTWEISKIEQIVCYSHTYFHTLGMQQTGKTEKGCFS